MPRHGWVKLFRSVLEDPLLNKDPEYLALWVHLLCNAAFEPTPALLGRDRIILQPGQLTTGRKQLSVNSGISESKVERALTAFENAQLIEQRTTSRNRLISIVSWSEYSASEQQSERQSNNERTAVGQQPNTLEEFKNVRNEESRKSERPRKPPFVPPAVEEVRSYCQERENAVDPERFVDYYTANGWVVGKTPMRDWKAAVRTWEKNNKKDGEQSVQNTGADQSAAWNLPGATRL